MTDRSRQRKKHTFPRATFVASRDLEFFTAKELTMQIGHPPGRWPIALVKELIDNALDACENAQIEPVVEVVVGADSVTVRDNGPGLPADTIAKSLDYSVRVSDKAYYVSPTRGQLGNALKCVWAAPFVANGERGTVEVVTGGVLHRIDVSLDRIAQKPSVQHQEQPAVVKSGTSVRLHWPQIACLLEPRPDADSYNDPAVDGLEEEDGIEYEAYPSLTLLLQAYAAFNKHATLVLQGQAGALSLPAADPAWEKWQPCAPTCAHWYTPERLRDLIAAYLERERHGGRALSARGFVQMFAGLRGTARQQQVTRAARLHKAMLADLVRGGGVDMAAVHNLLAAMKEASREIRSKVLGVVGKDHLTVRLVRDHGVEPDSVRYQKALGKDGLPFVLEVALGVKADDTASRTVLCGVNWSPALRPPFEDLHRLLGQMRVDAFDPVAVLVHLACPRADFTDRGKSRITLSPAAEQALHRCLRLVTDEWKQLKRQADRLDRLTARQLDQARRVARRGALSIRDAAFEVMRRAYLETSDNGALPAQARQIMYKARPLVLELTGGKCWKQSSYFTQKLLPQYMDSHPGEAGDWDVVFDARGHIVEPFTEAQVGLGTLEVRDYVRGWAADFAEEPDPPSVDWLCPTSGPANRFRFALFVEKEGFGPLLARAQIAERFGVALMSTKGMTVTAARALIEDLSGQGVTILVIRDFDKAGFSIVHTMHSDTDRYTYRRRPNVIDLGLRLADVAQMQLASEQVEYGRRRGRKRLPVDPRINLRQCGATEEECDYLVRRLMPGGWWEGERVELNAMASRQFVDWLEGKLVAHGVRKLIPDRPTLAKAFRRAMRLVRLEQAMKELVSDGPGRRIAVPRDLRWRVQQAMEGNTQSWDAAIADIARGKAAREADPSG
jgi:hypothetical protein